MIQTQNPADNSKTGYVDFRRVALMGVSIVVALLLLWGVTPAPVAADPTPTPCAADVNLVFIMDTSGSMGEELDDLCNGIDAIITKLQTRNITVINCIFSPIVLQCPSISDGGTK